LWQAVSKRPNGKNEKERENERIQIPWG